MSTIEIKVGATENETMVMAREVIAQHFAEFAGKRALILSAAHKVFAAMGMERIKQTHLIGSVGFLVRMPGSEFFIEGDVEDDVIQSVLDYAGFDGIGVRGTRGVGLPPVQAVQAAPAAIVVVDAPKKEEPVVQVQAPQAVSSSGAGKANVQKGKRAA